MTKIDIGYSEATTWTYMEPRRRRLTTADFSREVNLIGQRAIAILNAAKRCTQHGSGYTIHNAAAAIRKCVAAIVEVAPDSDDPELWSDALAMHLRGSAQLAEWSRWSTFNTMSGILREVARHRGTVYSRSNPFLRISGDATPVLHGDELAPLIARARRDAASIMTSFRAPTSKANAFINEARLFARGGLFIPGDARTRSPAVRLAQRWHSVTGLNLTDLTMHLHPSAEHIIPFLTLISYALAGNPDSVALMRRDAIVPFQHPSFGNCFKITLEKARAGEIFPYLVRDAGTLSVGWLIRAVLELTANLIPLAEKQDRNLVFLCATRFGNVMSLTGHTRTTTLGRYLRKNRLPLTTLKAMRTARGIDVYKKTGDPFRAQRLLNHADFAQTASYLNRLETDEHDALAIAEVQASMLRPSPQQQEVVEQGSSVYLSSHTCANPSDSTQPHDENGLCVSLLWPFNDVHFVLLLEPRPVAYLLRDYEALCEAEKAMPPGRFEKHYAARKRKIESDYLPLIDSDLRERALEVLPSLPSFALVAAL